MNSWRDTHTDVDRTHSLTRLHQHSYNHVVQSAISAITEFGIEFDLKVPEGGGWGGGGKLEYPEKTPAAMKPYNHDNHISRKQQQKQLLR